MSLEISPKSSEVDLVASRRKKVRAVFYRLYGDVVAELNRAVAERLAATGGSRGDLAKSVDQDPAVFSRVLSGTAGTNLRTVAAVLAAADYRLKIEAVACEDLLEQARERRALEKPSQMITLVSRDSKLWTTPSRLASTATGLVGKSYQAIILSPSKSPERV